MHACMHAWFSLMSLFSYLIIMDASSYVQLAVKHTLFAECITLYKLYTASY